MFDEDVDFNTVSSDTIVVRSRGGLVAGQFSIVARDTLRFQPACGPPEQPLAGGFRPDPSYGIVVRGTDTSPVTVQSTSGVALRTTVRASPTLTGGRVPGWGPAALRSPLRA